MSKSPLAGAFAVGSTPEKKKNKKGAALLIIAGIGLTASVGGVFAANSITINGGSSVEFGQGLASTANCVSNLTTTLSQEYDNTVTDEFKAKDVVIGGDFSSCAAKTVKVDLRNSSGTSLADFSFAVVSSGATGAQVDAGVATYTHDVSSPAIPAGDVSKITVTTE
jgi:hypothetical protein